MRRPLALNAIDRAVKALSRSRAAAPDLYRALIVGELHALVPGHPEIDDATFELQNGSPFPFICLQDAEGQYVPIFSSPGRLEEGLQRGRVPRGRYACASMPALQLLQIVGGMDLRAVLNQSCSTGQVILPPDLLRDLANGTALDPFPLPDPGTGEEITIQYVPADARPTALVQEVFEVMRPRASFRAAWLFTRARPPQPPASPWHLLVLMDPRDPAQFHDLNLVASAAAKRVGEEVSLALADETNPDEIRVLFEVGQPFYLAAGFAPPET